VTKRKQILPKFFHQKKGNQSSFAIRKMVGARKPPVPEILGQTGPVGAKRRFSIDIR